MITHIIRMSQRSDGMDIAEINVAGQTLKATSRHGAIMAVARDAIAAGAVEAPWVGVCSRTGATWLHGGSLVNLAEFTVSEPDRGKAKFVKWVPYVRTADLA